MEKKSLSQQTADRLYTMIVVEHRLSPGEKLPSEVELARELGVSRTTLREALHVLVSQKILEARRGRGTFVTDQAAQVNDYGFSHLDQVRGELKDLFELRAIFEPSAARLACLRATEEEMADILPGERTWTGASAWGRTEPRQTGNFTPPLSGPPTTAS